MLRKENAHVKACTILIVCSNFAHENQSMIPYLKGHWTSMTSIFLYPIL